jgi:hypothetical protein
MTEDKSDRLLTIAFLGFSNETFPWNQQRIISQKETPAKVGIFNARFSLRDNSFSW